MEIQPQDLKARLDAGEAIHLLDCREPFEFQLAHLAGAQLMPMNTIPAQLTALEALSDEKTIVVYCHHGMRSLNVVNWLRQQGITNSVSLAGGIDRWSLTIDPSVPRY